MSETKKDKTPPKNQKVGSDGLTKKERRALKVQANKSSISLGENKVVKDIASTESKSMVSVKKSGDNVKKGNIEHNDLKMEDNIGKKENSSNGKNENTKKENKGLPKTENPTSEMKSDGLSKKQRRALKVQAKQETDNAEKLIEKMSSKENQIGNEQENKTLQEHMKTKNMTKSKAELKAERKALFEKQQKEKTEKEVQEKLEVNNTEEVKTENIKKEEKSKAQLRAERRALQEKQRAAKMAAQESQKKQDDDQTRQNGVQKKNQKAKINIEDKNVLLKCDIPGVKKSTPKKEVQRVASKIRHQVQMFNHLYFPTMDEWHESLQPGIHPAFVQLGVQYLHKIVLGSNARCLALLSALKMLVQDYSAPTNQEFCRALESYLQKCVDYLQKCRPLAVSMMNTLRYFKLRLTQIDTNLSDSEKKSELLNTIDNYVLDEIEKAGEAISLKVQDKVTNGDVILTYGCSSLIKKILLDAHTNGKKFHVIVVDSRPIYEGQGMLTKLINAGITCSYVLINGINFIMSSVTKILLGAHALLSNGYVMSRIGTAQVALLAQEYNKPVLVCCETYKFSERVQTDSYVYNEIGDPNKLVCPVGPNSGTLVNWRETENVVPLNLMYDVAPPDLITAVVTELGFLPCTSVPVVLRVKPIE